MVADLSAWLLATDCGGLLISIAHLGADEMARVAASGVGYGDRVPSLVSQDDRLEGVGTASAAMSLMNTIDVGDRQRFAAWGVPQQFLARDEPPQLLMVAVLSRAPSATVGGTPLEAERLTSSPGATMSVRRHTQARLVSLEVGVLDISD